MGSYEEGVVDRSVESAWLQFRVRLAEHLVDLPQGDLLDLRIDMGDRSATVVLRCWRDETQQLGVGVLFDIEGDLRTRPAPGLRRFGFRDNMRLVEPDQVDSLVWSVERWLRLHRSVPHPSFVDVVDGELVLVDPPLNLVSPATGPSLPEAVTATSPDDLRLWVERILTARLGHEPRRSENGSFLVNDEAGQIAIRVGRRPIVEVWSIVARKVDVRRARKHVARMNARFHFFSFALVGDRVIVSTTVNASPLCPEHLDRAITSTLDYLEDGAADLQAKLARREGTKRDRPQHPQRTLTPELMLVVAAADDHASMIAIARDVSGDSLSTLSRWRTAARAQMMLARVGSRGSDRSQAVRDAFVEQAATWARVREALADAVEQIALEQSAS